MDEACAESSQIRPAKVKREKGNDVKTEHPDLEAKGRPNCSGEIIDISSGESDYAGDLDPDDQASLSRIKVHVIRVSTNELHKR